jgi:hypothetical protein
VDADDDEGAHHRRFGHRTWPPRDGGLPPDGDFVFWPLPAKDEE